MAQIIINVTADIGNYLRVGRFAEKNQPTLLKTAAERYLKYLRVRFMLASAGNGIWPELKASTILRKLRRGIATNPEWILREYDFLLNSLGVKIEGNQVVVGFTKNRRHPRGLTVRRLVRIHSAKGRSAIALPDRETGRRITDDVRKEYNKLIRRMRRAR